MPKKCCVPNYKGNYPNGLKVSCFKFSKDEKHKNMWVHDIKRLDFKHSCQSVVMRYMVLLTVYFIQSCTGTPFLQQQQLMELNNSTGTIPYECEHYNHEEDYEIHCWGKYLTEVPKDLNTSLNKLIVTDSDLKFITRDSYFPYKEKLQDVTLSGLPFLRVIEEGTFANIPKLRTIYIYNAPQLKFLHGLLNGVTSTSFKILRIVNTGLHEVPDFFHLPPENTMFLLDLDHNKIEKLASNSIKVSALQVTLNFNDIAKIEDYAFNGSQIGKLHIRMNRKLKELDDYAFSGMNSLRELDLSQSSIENLPYEGLEDLETLKIQETPSLQTIPSLYDLAGLRVAKMTHHFHCCAFKYPKMHSPKKHAQYQESMQQLCKNTKVNDFKAKRKRDLKYETNFPDPNRSEEDDRGSGEDFVSDPMMPYKMKQFIKKMPKGMHYTPLKGKFIAHQKPREQDSLESEEDSGFFHSKPTTINRTAIDVFCGNITFRKPEINCIPEPNALNPCEDIMGFSWLRYSVWFVVILAVVGNVAVVIVIWLSKTEVNVSRFLICNLAFADLCMGLYLLLIATMDYGSVGEYFNFAYNWQYGIGCQIAGFLTVFAGHLSIFTLTIVTLERWFAIKYAIDLTRRIRLRTAVKIMLAGWVYSILMAMFPLVGISNYSSTSICLPMEATTILDKIYLYSIFLINGISLGLIVFCYAQIYLSLGYETRRASHKGEMTIAKKMALLIFVDFATYAPIAFFGMMALIGYPLINITKSKILLVFFYPLNACANPYLYALTTSQYRRDLFMIISRCGICKRRAQKYSLTGDQPMIQKPMTNTSLLHADVDVNVIHHQGNNNCGNNDNNKNSTARNGSVRKENGIDTTLL